MKRVLEMKNLAVHFRTRKGEVCAVNGVSLSLHAGRTLALVGESGSGKSVTATSVLRLLDPNGRVVDGEIIFHGDDGDLDILKLPIARLREIRGNRVSMIFQEPMTALNPVLTIGKQLCEPLILHRKLSKKLAWEEAVRMLAQVRIPNPERVMKEYPHRLSGGMRQRVMIAIALSCNPSVLIADEPTTALDVTIQAQILKLMKELQKESGAAVLFITHDLGVVAETADDVAVLYCGQVVESAEKRVIFSDDAYSHPYTEGLFRSLPSGETRGKRLETIAGSVPPLDQLPSGCKFAPRCPYATEKCEREEPSLVEWESAHAVRCHYAEKKTRRKRENGRAIES